MPETSTATASLEAIFVFLFIGGMLNLDESAIASTITATANDTSTPTEYV